MDRKQILLNTELFVLDMDGTFYLSDDIIDGSLDFLETVRQNGKRFVFFTNNSSKDKGQYIEKLARMNCHIGVNDIITSGDVTTAYLNRNYPGQMVYLLGTPTLMDSFKKAGIKLTNGTEATPDIVVVGFDTTLTYDKLERACTFIRNGAVYIATHPDINCPVKDGFIPDCGAFIAAINLSTGRSPKILGKPYAETMDMVLMLTGSNRESTAFVGDRIYTDVATGVNNGAYGILVMSGETKEKDVERSEVKPDAVFKDLYEMSIVLKSAILMKKDENT